MRANFPGFGTDARGQRPCRCFQLRGPRTKVHGPVRLQNVRLYITVLSRTSPPRTSRTNVPGAADTGGHPRTLSFL